MSDQCKQQKIEFIYFNAGGGHKSAATALRNIVREKQPNWNVDLVNLEDILLPIDPVHMINKELKTADLYNNIIKRDITFGSEQALRFLQASIALTSPVIKKLLRNHWETTQPDMVVSIIPNFNRPMFKALKKIAPNTPYVTLMTDIADFGPHFWQETDQDQYIICGSDKAFDQANKNFAKNKIYLASGMIIKPQFYQPTTIDQLADKRQV